MEPVAHPTKPSADLRSWLSREGVWYAAAVVTGAALIVAAAINQPYNQNELEQMAPYGSSDLGEITSGTKQPPLDPLLGALVQHLLGVGQLRQRLVPVAAGIGTLILVSLLLRRLRLGWAGVLGVWVLATAPLMVRYSAYTRPYALPLFLMMLFAYATQRWLDDRKPGWLILVGLPAAALPIVRVPEPTVFLVATAAVFAWLGYRHRRPWSDVWPLIAVSMGALAFIGLPMNAALAAAVERFDPSPSGVVDRFGSGVDEIWNDSLPLLADYLPWWPVTILLVATVLVLPAARRQLSQWWMWWPAVAAPVVFFVAFHFMVTFDLYVKPYRARFAYFLLPAVVMIVVAIACALRQVDSTNRRLRAALAALLAATFIGQLPATAKAVLTNEAPDYGQVAQVLTEQLPPDAIVLYDAPSPAYYWRLELLAKPRYMGDTPFAIEVEKVPSRPRTVPLDGPVYVLILDSQCAASVVCDLPAQRWKRHDVDGWEITSRFDRFTLYAPTEGQSGRDGVIQAMRAFGRALGPDLGWIEWFAAASLLRLDGRDHQAGALIRRMYQRAEPDVVERIRDARRKAGGKP